MAAGLLPYGAEFFGKILAEFGEDAQRRAREMMTSAADAMECEPHDLTEKAMESEQTRLFTTTATFGAAQTTWPPKVRALGRVLADGLIAEDDKIETAGMALSAMTEMERPHVSLLELLTCHVPVFVEDKWTSTPYHQDSLRESGIGQPDGRAWQSRAILAIQPNLAPVFRGVIETLVRHGLVFERDRTTEAFRRYSTSLNGYMRRLAQRAQHGGTVLPDSPGGPDAPSLWSPTQFGEQVIGYYREAGEGRQFVPLE